jgi:hypothetical protein
MQQHDGFSTRSVHGLQPGCDIVCAVVNGNCHGYEQYLLIQEVTVAWCRCCVGNNDRAAWAFPERLLDALIHSSNG